MHSRCSQTVPVTHRQTDLFWLFLGKEEHCAEQEHCTLCHTSLLPRAGGKDTKGEVQGNQLMWKTRSGQAEISTCLISADAPEVVPNNVGNCLVLIYV